MLYATLQGYPGLCCGPLYNDKTIELLACHEPLDFDGVTPIPGCPNGSNPPWVYCDAEAGAGLVVTQAADWQSNRWRLTADATESCPEMSGYLMIHARVLCYTDLAAGVCLFGVQVWACIAMAQHYFTPYPGECCFVADVPPPDDPGRPCYQYYGWADLNPEDMCGCGQFSAGGVSVPMKCGETTTPGDPCRCGFNVLLTSECGGEAPLMAPIAAPVARQTVAVPEACKTCEQSNGTAYCAYWMTESGCCSPTIADKIREGETCPEGKWLVSE
jgi:hypothetical protein